MPRKTLWDSPRIPEEVFEGDEKVLAILERVDVLHAEDTPSPGDLKAIFRRYNESTRAERDAIDAAFVWLTGYTLARVAAMVVADSDDEVEGLLDAWQEARPRRN